MPNIISIDQAFDEGCAAVLSNSLLFQILGGQSHTGELEVEMEVLDTVYVTCAVEVIG